jgi:hypothetical protein
MAKIDPLNDLVNLQSETTAVQVINANNDKVVAAVEKTLSRDGSTPNDMSANIDMGGFRITNVGAPVDPNDVVRLSDIGGISPTIIADIENAAENAQRAEDAADDAEASAALAASYIGSATSAQKWTTARTLTLTGNVTGATSPFDGSGNITLSTTIAAGAVAASMLAVGAAVNNIGYTPLNKAGDTMTGPVTIGYTASSLTGSEVGFRILPAVGKDVDYVFVMDDAGRFYIHNSGSAHVYYIPNNTDVAFPQGTTIVVRNNGAGNVTLAPADGSVSLRKAGSGTSGNVVMSQWGLATLIKEAVNAWVVTGVGIT